MAYLLVIEPNGKTTTNSIFKRLTSLGKGDGIDISLTSLLNDKIIAYISESHNNFTLIIPQGQSRVVINNVCISKHELQHEDKFTFEGYTCQFFLGDAPKIDQNNASETSAVIAYRRMLDFSQRIAKETDIDALLKRLLTEITHLTGAEHGFLVLIENGKPIIRVQEPDSENQIESPIGPISDSIVKRVIEKEEPVILSNASNDQEFSTSLSVINYRLTSVMCVPLTYQGHTFGAIYVGNNSFVSAFNKQSLELMTIYSSQAALLVQNALHINALKKRTQNLMESLELTKFGGVIGGCVGMQNVFQQVEKLATAEVSVTIVGETGTGKELIARELHNRSPRRSGPFVIFNCGAVSEDLLQSELFGHVRGAFLGATQSHIGKLKAANEGTLFLEEINGLPLYLQQKLFQALSENRVCKMGDHRSEKIDVRIIASTNNDLQELVIREQFRKDLYYRLNVMQINVPPLRERGNDILVIANFFLQKYAKIYGKNVIGIEENAQNLLLNYEWPGNVRQLENRIRRAIVMCDQNRITTTDLDISTDVAFKVMPLADALEKYRARYINESLERNGNNRTKTASELGVDPRTIFRHLEQKKRALNESTDVT